MKITFMPMNQKEELHPDETILACARRANVAIETECASCGKCGKCKVIIMKGEVSALTCEEDNLLAKEDKDRGIRLACQTRGKSDLVVMVLNSQKIKTICKEEKTVVETSKKELGVSIDIGTTTIELRIYDLVNKVCLIKMTGMNPQRRFGADVIARITYGMGQKEHLESMRKCLIQGCNDMVGAMLLKIGAKRESIRRYVGAGNTTMGHILEGLPVDSLGKAPIKPVCYEYNKINCKEIGLLGAEDATLELLNNIGGHVGGDTTAGLLTSGLFHKGGNYLFIDVGTNGEIALSKNGKVYVCSTAAGPAFEGASLTHGMCAAIGAITHVAVYHTIPVLEVMGNQRPIGITGSGIIDAIACMRKINVIDESGLLIEPYQQSGYCLYGTGDEQITISQDDIRQIQLAKAAIAAGASLMMKQAEIEVTELDGCYLAGTFGSYLNIQNAMTIGLIPNIPVSKVTYLGNASCDGAAGFLLGKYTKEEVNGLLADVVHLDLANEAEFQKIFVENLNF